MDLTSTLSAEFWKCNRTARCQAPLMAWVTGPYLITVKQYKHSSTHTEIK